MKCDRRLLSFYRDGELTPDQKWEVDQHLRECADCTAALRGYIRLAQTVRSLPVEPVPPSVAGGVRRGLAERRRRSRLAALGGLARAAAPTFAAAAAAVAILVVLRPGAGEPSRPTPSIAAPAAGQGAVVAGQPTAETVVVTTPSIVPVRRDQAIGLSGTVAEERLTKAPASISRLYAGSPALREQLGMPAEGSKSVALLEQSFQGGLALRRSDTREIYVLNRDGGIWSAHPDVWHAAEPVVTEAVPPPGALVPAAGFGHLWLSHPEIQSRLGWAVYAPRGSGGAIQAFERGLIIWSPHGLLYVLTNDGRWKTYPDAAPL